MLNDYSGGVSRELSLGDLLFYSSVTPLIGLVIIGGERLGELRALLSKLLTRRPKSVLGELFRRLAGAERGSRLSHGRADRVGQATCNSTLIGKEHP